MTRFEVGKRYFKGCAYPSSETYTIIRRTEKSVWDQYGKRHAVKVDDRGEYFNVGSYAWHPVCRAFREWSPEEAERMERREREYFMTV